MRLELERYIGSLLEAVLAADIIREPGLSHCQVCAVLPKVNFTPIESLFREEGPVPPRLMKDSIVQDFKDKELIGVPDAELRISFPLQDGDDILIHRIDPENALGYSVYASEEDYFNHLQAELYEPTDEEILGGLE
jgi:hypothetical protein